ncbi:MAG: metal ABC transporter permease [Planctomycetota bacterium]
MVALIDLHFMQLALAAGVMVGFLASYYGVFVVQRGLGFMGSGLAHAAFGGVALGLLLGAQPLWIAVPFTVFVAIAITWVRERTKLGSDTVIGIFFAVSMALGIVFLSLTEGYTRDAFTYLFGSILAVTSTDLWVIGFVVLVAILLHPLWGRWAYATFDREMAAADRVPVRRDDYLLSVLIAVSVVTSVKLVGVVLVSAFLVIPAATARLPARRFSTMAWLSVEIGVATAFAGLLASYWLNIPSGACIVLTQGVLFLICLLASKFLFPAKARP